MTIIPKLSINLPLHSWEIFVGDMVLPCDDKELWTLNEIYFENVHGNLKETKRFNMS